LDFLSILIGLVIYLKRNARFVSCFEKESDWPNVNKICTQVGVQ